MVAELKVPPWQFKGQIAILRYLQWPAKSDASAVEPKPCGLIWRGFIDAIPSRSVMAQRDHYKAVAAQFLRLKLWQSN